MADQSYFKVLETAPENKEEILKMHEWMNEKISHLQAEQLMHEYDLKAASYDGSIAAARGGAVDAFIQFALGHIKECDKRIAIIDIAAGSGEIGEKLHSFGFTNISAHDGSKEMLKLARKRNVYKYFFEEFLVEDTPSSKIPRRSFDLLVSVGGFSSHGNHLTGNHLSALVDMVKPGGLVLLGAVANAFDDKFKNKVLELSDKCSLIGEHIHDDYITELDEGLGKFVQTAGKFWAFRVRT